MDGAAREMPRYKCHKEVHALKIKAIVPPIGQPIPGMHRILEWEDSQYAPTPVPEDWIKRHSPEPGGYYVVYEDGYESYSPAEAFEKGYAAIGEIPAPPPGPGPKKFMAYTPSEAQAKTIENNFTYHAPKHNQPERYQLLRDHAKSLAVAIATQCPPSREQSLALTKLEEVAFWANAAIARNE